MKRILPLAIVALLLSCASVPDSVTSWVEAPPSVRVGEAFLIRAHVNNGSEQPVVLHEIDVGDPYLAGIVIDGTRPTFTELYRIAGMATYVFNRTIAPGEHFVVEFSAQALQPGIFQGDLDFCVNSSVNCSFQTITTQVVADPQGS